MLRSPVRLVAILIGSLALVSALAVAYLLLPPRQTAHIARPALNATPEQVVTAYLEALNTHDCRASEALMTEGSEDTAAAWCHDVASLSNLKVMSHIREQPEQTGHSAPDEVANVPVTFSLDWRPLQGDGSMNEGDTTWAYFLVRTAPEKPWRIFDQGCC